MNYLPLTEGQRYQIALLYEENCCYQEIALWVGVSKFAISRELRRNATPYGYAPEKAQRLYEQ